MRTMNFTKSALTKSRGFSLLEILVAVLILAIGLLGMAGLQLVATRSVQESFQRSQAILLMQDMVDRINVNRKSARSYDLGTGYLGTGSSATCGVSADTDCQAWAQMLLGAAEKSAGGTSVGAMIGARGCISYDATTELPSAPDTGIYTVSVVWQSQSGGFTPPGSVPCGQNLYPDESQRRFVFTQFRVGKLI